MNYIIWNNRNSQDIQGLIICELPPISKPQMRVVETTVDGVDGSVIEELGYESYDKTISIGLKVGADIDSIIEYFTGNGDIVFSNESNKVYKARIIQRIDFARLLRYRTAIVTFRVQPFKYKYQEEEKVGTSSIAVTNDGNCIAKPIITITGSGTVTLKVNGSNVCQYTFPSGDTTVTIDSEKQDAYYGSTLKNRNMVGEFPSLAKGGNTISCDGSVSRISIKRYSRWL